MDGGIMRKAKFLTIALTFFLVLAVSVFADTCYNSVRDIPATCEGGSISSDSWNGCRKIVCSSGANSQQILACDKSGFFEMYKQTTTGSGVSKVCIGSTCISNAGYAKSANFPICMGTTPNTTNTTNPPPNTTNSTPPWTNTTNSTQNNGACYTKVNQLPVTCTGGTVTTDTGTGCRTIVCSSGSSSLKAMACDKPTTTSPTYFEVYKQAQTGTAVTKICFGNSCVGSAGFAKGTYPVCTGTAPNSTNTTQPSAPNTTNSTNTTGSATVLVDNYVSKDHNALFQCVTPDFTPAEFRWDFGDGQTRVKNTTTVNSMNYWPYYYHTYLNNGTYTVTCTAINGSKTATGSTVYTVRTEAKPDEIARVVPADDREFFNPYVFRPIVRHVTGPTYDVGGYAIGLPRNPDGTGQDGSWAGGTGFSSQYTSTHPNVLRITFPEPGAYDMYPSAGINDDRLTPEQYNSGWPKRGCSNPRSLCHWAGEQLLEVNIPDLGTRVEYGILTRQTSSGAEISCQSYASDAGLGGWMYIDHNFVQYTGNQWFPITPGTHEVQCNQWVNDAMQKVYQETVTVSGTTTPPESNASATVTVAKWYPKGRDYIFECNAQGFTPTRYDYNFGDGHTWDDVTFDDTYHRYANPGTYTVTCTAENDQISKTGSMTVTVQ